MSSVFLSLLLMLALLFSVLHLISWFMPLFGWSTSFSTSVRNDAKEVSKGLAGLKRLYYILLLD